jgi:hypothetical protein
LKSATGSAVITKFELIPGNCVVDTEGCRRNVESALRRDLRVCGWAPLRTGQLAIVGSGPSVLSYLDELRSWPGEIWAVNGAYRFLLGQGIVPHAFVGLDPVPGLKEYVEVRDRKTAFLISSVCDPCVFDELKDAPVFLWHSKQSDFPYPEGSAVVGGGTTCLTRAPFLAHMVGWRDITVYGGDCSFSDDVYCYPLGTFKEDTSKPQFEVEVNGKVFLTELALLKQLSVFGVMEPMFNGVLKFRCGGMLEAFLASPMYEIADGQVRRSNAA